MATPEEIDNTTPDNPAQSDQHLTDQVDDREKAMQQSNKDAINQAPPPPQEPAGNAKQQPQRRLG